MNLLLPCELKGFVPKGIPDDHIHYANLSRPRSLKNIGANFKYLANARADARSLLHVAREIDSHLLLSHGPHFLTAAIAARMSGLPLAVFIHSAAAPSWSAHALRLIRRPDVVGYELPSTKNRFAPLFRSSPSFQLAPVLDPGFGPYVGRMAPGSKIRVGFVATFSPRKRVDKFLALVDHPDSVAFDFRLIGSVASDQAGWWAEHLQPRVEFLLKSGRLEWIDGSMGVSDAMGDLDFLIITSDDEGVPNVAMEALSQGCVVISLGLEGLGVLRDRLPTEARDSIRQVRRGKDETDRIIECLIDAGVVQRAAISQATRAATSPARGVEPIAAALESSVGIPRKSSR
ncbi:hypothetical protein [Mycolicibacterium holsaticum]|uniref:hypothetical protein n=1 Tax=Mycolicibacterium holsaticum TaxID=152142 RepID=UPI001C7D1770|nr:hypothetical protein [Mycolicibacterium holsaticum]QZA11800.1 hypothetical protein K3U96_21870 [Mycolicibacterium holsaticum DSM 44478 = JCM 12374]UNC10712.1 hypothetical protein H5U41_04955 [Mycolicibacterium holsaticum DSM 44478 = JCM 12374]